MFLNLFATKWYAVNRTTALSRLGRYETYTLVVLLTKECGDTDMSHRWSGVHFTERDQFRNALLSRDVPSGYGCKYPSDLRSPQWLASNLLYFGTELAEFLILERKVTGCSQVLAKSVRESRWNWPLLEIGDNAVFNLAKSWPGQSLWWVTGFLKLIT